MQWALQYIEIRRRDVGAATLASHGRTLELLARHFGADRDLCSITRREAQQFRLWLSQQYSETTVCKHVRAAKVIWRIASDWEVTRMPSPWQGVRSTAPVMDVTDRKPLGTAEGEALIAAAGPRWRCIVAVFFYAGLRRNEALSLRWSDVDLAGGRINVRHEGARTTKKRRRVARLEPRLREILESHLAMQAEAGTPPGPHSLVVGDRGNHRTGISHVVRTIGERAGIRGVTPQVLRQARSTAWFTTFPHHVAAAWMGHSAEVARRHYLGVPDEYYAPGDPVPPRGGTGNPDLTRNGPERTVSLWHR